MPTESNPEMHVASTSLTRSTPALLLLVCLSGLGSSATQAFFAHHLSATTIEAYAPKIEKQAVKFIAKALPRTDEGRKAEYLAEGLAKNVEGQYTALSRAVQSKTSALAYQALGWAVASILALFVLVDSRRKVAGAA